ncbi:MAG: archease [Candidatus Thermoplasmatota archaeon]|nr:archease [Candidatus Thermoplasmatota archaeon]
MSRIFRPPDQGVSFEEHTADLWLIAEGSSIEEVFKRALTGLYSVIASEFEIDDEREEMEKFKGTETEEILIDILSEALYLFDAESRVIMDPRFELERNNEGIMVRMWFGSAGVRIKEGCHGMEVKAATYHGTEIAAINKVHRARILLDI